MAPEKERSYKWIKQVLVLAVAVALCGCSESGGRQQVASTDQASQVGERDLGPPRTARPVAQSDAPTHSRPIFDPEKSGASTERTSPDRAGSVQGPRKKPVTLSKDEPTATRTAEKISGYAVPSEYFFIRSRNYAQAVVAVTLPEDYESRPDKKYPLVIVFGGAGECARTPRDGALAWLHYYKADEAVKALRANELTNADFRGLVKQSELNSFNRRLSKHPY